MEQTFGERLQMLRKRRGMTQGDLAGLLGVAVQTIVRYESSPEAPKPARLASLAQALQVDPRDLSGGAPGPEGEPGEEDIRILTRGLRMMAPAQRENLIRMMMPLVRQYQVREDTDDDPASPA